MHWQALKKTKDVIGNYLNMYLSNAENYSHLIPPQLDKDHYLQAQVYVTEPEELRQFPTIILSGSGGNMITSGLGDMALEIYDQRTGELMAYRYGGIYEFNITVEIGARSTLDREVCTDIITKALRFDLKRKIEAAGVIINNMHYGSESVLQYNSDHIYVATINFTTWSEWYEDIELLPLDGVKINN